MTSPFKKITDSLHDVFPTDLSNEIRGNVRAMVEASLRKMDLVTREELEVQEKVLIRTREKLEALQARIEALEGEQE
ncbi:MAG: accessory factor UbiK family protein [Gammaproteobacteria bacterium]|nr:accessory factor UbiK family protein [Gammaproteobacteria bacterium]RZO22235.1 MAG: accessory factor UbiK family protein [Candidatus Thioglobus sp.]|tara:strand:- start:407 stop:637 length:231 start_codon:yes stop_codon:yes gene_type:complete